MEGQLNVGSVVRVGLHGRNVRAFVTELLDEPAVANPRPVSRLVSPAPIFDADTIELAQWVARRYVVPLGQVLHDAVPGRFSLPESSMKPPGNPARVSDALAPGGLGEGLANVIRASGGAWMAPPTILMLHNTMHRPFFKSPRIMNRIVPTSRSYDQR
jgi:primosomal protein N'